MKRFSTVTIAIFLGCIVALSQRHEIHSADIASLTVVANENWQNALPIIQLGSGQTVNIEFDDLTHEYHRYVYKIEHCEADWTKSAELFESDYTNGFNNGNTIDDIEESVNTNILYTHYRLTLPNDRCSLKISGNYKLTIYDENKEDTPIITACFMVVEPLMTISLETTTNTDIDINKNHQQISMSLNYGNLNITNPTKQIKTVVLQNGRWDNARINISPQYIFNDGLKWNHCRDFIFDAGNEYHKFETLDISHTTMGLERMEWDGKNFNAYVWQDEPRENYLYDEDANGAFTIRNSDNNENDITCEYVKVHFSLKSSKENKDVYLNGNWTNDRFLPEYRMEYNDSLKCYEACLMLKQGYYSYQYLTLDNNGNTAFLKSEGNFYQTKNKYQALVYYKGTGSRTDRLVAIADVSTK